MYLGSYIPVVLWGFHVCILLSQGLHWTSCWTVQWRVWGGWGAKVVATRNLGLVWGVFFSLSLSWSSPLFWSFPFSSSSSSQSDYTGNSFMYIFPSGIHIAQYLVCLVNFTGGTGKVGDSVDGVSVAGWSVSGPGWLFAPVTSLAFLSIASQFHWVVSGRGLTFIFLGCESFALFGLIDGTRLCFLVLP